MHSFDLRILSLDEARRAEAGAVLSLVDHAEEVDFRAGLHEIVAVADICSPAPDENETAKLAEMGLTAPTSHHAQQVIAFADRLSELLQQGSVSVVIHCFVGVSRSPAAAIGVLCRHGWSPNEACARVREVTRDTAHPNDLLVLHLDRALGLKGKLLTTVLRSF